VEREKWDITVGPDIPAGDGQDPPDTTLAAFEAGIKLGGLFHQFIGTPLTGVNAEVLEEAMARSVLQQPYVVSCGVAISRTGLKPRKDNEFDYTTLTPDRLEVHLVIRHGTARVSATMKWDEEMQYPLMSIQEILSTTDR